MEKLNNCKVKRKLQWEKMLHMSCKKWHVSLRFPPKTRVLSFILTTIILATNKRIRINGTFQHIIPFDDLSQIWDTLLIFD